MDSALLISRHMISPHTSLFMYDLNDLNDLNKTEIHRLLDVKSIRTDGGNVTGARKSGPWELNLVK